MSALAPSSATIAAAYDPSQVLVSDRMLSIVEAPQGAMALLAGLRRQCEGGPLNILVRPWPDILVFSSACMRTHLCDEYKCVRLCRCLSVFIPICRYLLQSHLDSCVP